MKAELKLVVDNQPVKKKDRKKQSKKAELKVVDYSYIKEQEELE